mmetsp:Transcript_3831/g.10407  ORF Transcript_3831/g.10407 Transcript_3831/m.10407 type:complete len:258 (+) Transcript_3831:922-1695(+)
MPSSSCESFPPRLPPSQCSMTICPFSAHEPLTLTRFGWLNVEMTLISFWIVLATSSGTPTAPAPGRTVLTSHVSPRTVALHTVPNDAVDFLSGSVAALVGSSLMSSAAISGWTSMPSFNRGNAICSAKKFCISSISTFISRKSSARSGTILSAIFFIPCLIRNLRSAGLKKMAMTANAADGPRPINTTSDIAVVAPSRNSVLIHGPSGGGTTIQDVGTPSTLNTDLKCVAPIVVTASLSSSIATPTPKYNPAEAESP